MRTNAENYFGFSGGVCEPAWVGGWRSRGFEGGEERAFGEAAGGGVCGAGDDHAGAYSLARALFVARSCWRGAGRGSAAGTLRRNILPRSLPNTD